MRGFLSLKKLKAWGQHLSKPSGSLKAAGHLAFLAVTLVLVFQNCARPYDMNLNPYVDAPGALSTAFRLMSNDVTNDPTVQLTFKKAHAREMYVVLAEECAEGGEWKPFQEKNEIQVGPEDGIYPISAKFRNYKKTETPCFGTSITLDRTPPQIMFPASPASIVGASHVELAVTATDNLAGVAKVVCSLNQHPLAACEGPLTLGDLTDGSYQFEVSATDRAGNVSETSVKKWLVDTLAPVLVITGKPPMFTNVTTAEFQFEGSDSGSMISDFKCAVDAMNPVTCTSPKSYTGVAEGQHSFEVTVTDNAGNAITKSADWYVDVTKPVLAWSNIDGTPRSFTSDNTPTFKWTIDDRNSTNMTTSGIATVTCQLDMAAPVACGQASNELTFPALADGPHTMKVVATDKAGNSSDLTYSFTVDVAGPSITWVQRPADNSWVNTSTVNLRYSVVDPQLDTVTCTLEGMNVPCSTDQADLTGLAEKALYTFVVTARDKAGNQNQAMTRFRVDTTKPRVTFVGLPAIINAVPFVIAWTIDSTISGTQTLECAIVQGSTVTRLNNCGQTQISLTNLVDGNYTFRLTVTDNAGNVEVANQPVQLSITPATIAFSSPTNNQWLRTRTPQITFSVTQGGSRVATTTCKVDNETPVACESPFTANLSTDGNHSVQVRVVDEAGTVSQQTINFRVDTTMPTITVNNKPAAPPAWSQTAAPSITYSLSSGGSNGSNLQAPVCTLLPNNTNVSCNNSQVQWSSSNSPSESATTEYKLRIAVSDEAGNSATQEIPFKVDTGNPSATQITSGCPTSNDHGSRNITFSFSSSDVASGIKKFVCRLNGPESTYDRDIDCGTLGEAATSHSYTGLNNGNYTFRVYAVDNANRQSAVATCGQFRVAGNSGMSTPAPTATPQTGMNFASPTPSPTPTATPTPAPTATPALDIIDPNPTPAPTPMPTAAPTPDPTPMPTATPFPTATPMPTATPAPTPSPTPVMTPTPSPTPMATAAPAPSPTPANNGNGNGNGNGGGGNGNGNGNNGNGNGNGGSSILDRILDAAVDAVVGGFKNAFGL